MTPYRKMIFWLLLTVSTASCQTIHPDDSGKLLQGSANNESAAEESVALSPAPLLPFCQDNLYASYLRQRHLETTASDLRRVSSATERRRLQANREVEAATFARTQLLGPEKPHLGAIPVVYNAQTEAWIRYFTTRGRQTFLRWMVRAEAANELIGPILSEQGMPQEFLYLAMIESGFNNAARSHARAVGPWQFMLGTGRLYGLRVNHWVDERRDPEKATVAAASYLRDLYGQFGDWYLAMAAYNAGPGRIRSAIRRTGSRDFWALAQSRHLPRETQNYVPKILAAIIIANNRELYGFAVTKNPQDLLPQTAAMLPRPVRLQELAAQVGTTVAQIKQWNPELINDITPPLREGQQAYQLRLPQQYVQVFDRIAANLAYLEISDVQMHRIRQGETLSHIARRYRVTVRDIMNVNPNVAPNRLRIGREIAIPIPGVSEVRKLEQPSRPTSEEAA